jgi:putative acetyltransferase
MKAASMHIRIEDPATPDITAMLEQHLADMRAISAPESKHALDIESLRAPGITFWAVRDGAGTIMGCGAIRQLDVSHAEIKSMRTAPTHRRKGVAAAFLAHIITTARSRGIQRLSLETGSQPEFVPARTLYARSGFTPCGPFAEYRPDPNSAFMTLALDGV